MVVGANYPETDIGLNIGMPFFADKKLFVSFAKMQMCALPD